MHNAVQHIAAQIIAAKKDVNIRTSRGLAEQLLQEAKESFPRISINMINYTIKTIKEKMIKSTITLSTSTTNISSLTGDNSTNTSTCVSSISDEASANDATINITKSTTTADEHSCSGRPKGATDAASKILEKQVEAAMQEAAETLKKSKRKGRSSKTRLQWGLLYEILSAAKKTLYS
jgi:hypothetical protein